MLLSYFFLAVLGLAVGSFVGMLTWRLPRHRRLLGRSKCDACAGKISWTQNIPVLSFLFLGGRCAHCKARISPRYVAIEAATAAAFVLSGFWWQHADSLLLVSLRQELGFFSLVFILAATAILISLVVVDLEFQILPDLLIGILGLAVLLVVFILPSPAFFAHLFWGAAGSSFLLLVYIVTGGRGMGFGDVKLAAVLGTLLGYPVVLVWLFLAFLSGGAVGLGLVAVGKAKIGQHVAFGPYLIFAAWISLFFGQAIWEWYIGMV